MGEFIKSLISSQRSLRFFRLTGCKGYTRIFFPPLASHKKTLRHISFDQVDFKGCGEWTSISECTNLELLEILQCYNLEYEMIRPLINNTATDNGSSSSKIMNRGFGKNFEVRYIKINPFCREFEEWVNSIQGHKYSDVELPFSLNETTTSATSGSNNKGKRGKEIKMEFFQK